MASMTVFSHVLVPIDFGDASNHALLLAVTMAKTFQAKLTLVHVCVTVPAGYTYAEGLSWPTYEMENLAKDEVDKLLASVRETVPSAEAVILGGEPWRRILDVAKEREVDLIVMGTHGRTGVSHLLIGSVAEKITRHSPVPVLIVGTKDTRTAKERSLAELGTIVNR